MTRPLHSTASAAGLVIVCWLAYAHVVLRAGFVSDDFRFICNNLYVQDIRRVPSFFVSTASWDWSQDMYRPLRSVGFAAEFALWGLNPRPFHAVSVLLHGLNGLLVFLVAKELGGRRCGAALVAALFVLHPVQMEPVGWIGCLSDPLFALFGMLAILFHARRRRTASVCAFALSLLSKEMAASIPLLLILVDLAHKRGRRIAVPFAHFGVLAAYMVLRVAVLRQWGQSADLTAVAWLAQMGARLALGAMAFARALDLLLFPVNLSVGRAWDIPLGGLTVCACVLWLTFLGAGGRSARVGGAWLVISLLPLSGILPLKTHYQDRYLYLPCIGAFAMMAAACARARDRPRSLGLLLTAIVCCAGLTLGRGFVWMSARELAFDTVRKSPADPINHFGLANVLRSARKFAPAVRAYERALMAKPDDRRIVNNLASTYLEMGRRADGVRLLEKMVSVDPGYDLACFNLAKAYASDGELDRAADVLRKCLGLTPHAYRLWLFLGDVLERGGRTEEAAQAFRQAAAIHPSRPRDGKDE